MNRIIAEEVITITPGGSIGLTIAKLSPTGTGTAQSVRIRVQGGAINYAFTAPPTGTASFVQADASQFDLSDYNNLTNVVFANLGGAPVSLFVAYGY